MKEVRLKVNALFSHEANYYLQRVKGEGEGKMVFKYPLFIFNAYAMNEVCSYNKKIFRVDREFFMVKERKKREMIFFP